MRSMLALDNAIDSKDAPQQATIRPTQMKEEVQAIEMSGECEGRERRESRVCYLGPRCGNFLMFLSLTHTHTHRKKQWHSLDTAFIR